MEQHPIPRQITTFEFKLIGFLTIKQFIYLIIFIPLGFVVYTVFPIPLLNILFGVLVGAVGAAFAFLPINDRPLDVWIRNFVRRLTSPTQYLYLKDNTPLYFLGGLFFAADPHRMTTHIQAQELLTSYLAKNSPVAGNNKKQGISQLFQLPSSLLSSKPATKMASPMPLPTAQPTASLIKTDRPEGRQAFFTGTVKNHKLIPIPGILIYVKNEKGDVLRLLRSNIHGVFASFSPLPEGKYLFEIKDPNEGYFFDTMEIKVESSNLRPLEIFSKELL